MRVFAFWEIHVMALLNVVEQLNTPRRRRSRRPQTDEVMLGFLCGW
jgi:hypothetical protein